MFAAALNMILVIPAPDGLFFCRFVAKMDPHKG